MTHQSVAVTALAPLVQDSLEVRLAASRSEVEAAQRIRYRVFYDEMGARPTAEMARLEMDFDAYDEVCDHLVALAEGEVIGTYRLIRRGAALKVGRFYSSSEFDISRLVNRPGEILELGRSCVDARWRHRGTLQLLWQGLAAYMVAHEVTLLFGCGSLPGTDMRLLEPQLAYLRDTFLAPPDLRAKALCGPAQVPFGPLRATWDARRVLAELPPLLKGYLRLGGTVGDGAVIDHAFNTTDVLVAVDTARIADRYARRFGA